MKISIFDIPPIRHLIDEYLSLCDLVNCALVSKEWNAWLNQKLWSGIDFESDINIEGLARNQHNVRRIYNFQPSQSLFPQKMLNNTQKQAVQSIHFNRLHSVHIKFRDMKLEDYDRLILLVQQNPCLKSIELHEPRSFRQGFNFPLDRVIPAIQSCSLLESLTLTFNGHIPPDDIQHHEQLLIIKASIQQMKKCNIRNLSINTMGSDLSPFISIPLMENCPKLEKLTVSTLSAEKSLPLLTKLFQGGLLPSLTQLDINFDSAHDENFVNLIHSLGTNSSRNNEGGSNFNNIENLVRSLEAMDKGSDSSSSRCGRSSSSNIYSSSSGSDNNNSQCRPGLKKLIFSGNQYIGIGLPVIRSIIKYHHRSLTELYVAAYGMSIYIFHLLVDNLPNLKSITMSLSLNPTYDDQFITQDVLEHPWNWSNLIKLDLSFAPTSSFASGNTNTIQERIANSPKTLADISLPQRMGFIFSQIGRLTILEELGLGCHSSILLLKEGHLEVLAGLRRLWSLDLSEYNGRISVEEAYWMIKNWPKLDRVILYSREGGLLPLAYLKNEKHREFMKEIRLAKPSVQIRVGNSIMSPSGSIPLISSDYIINSAF